jgi:hypothetical protein
MSTAPHDDNNHDRDDGDDERASTENAAAHLRAPVATLQYWRPRRMVCRADRRPPRPGTRRGADRGLRVLKGDAGTRRGGGPPLLPGPRAPRPPGSSPATRARPTRPPAARRRPNA